MSQNMNRHLTALEFDKILERLAQFTACPDARELALSLRPESDIDLAQAQMNQTRDAYAPCSLRRSVLRRASQCQ